MTLYTDESCGIVEPHRHTGEIVSSHYIQYWCPFLCKWLDRGELCECTEKHMKARTQSTVTEIIEILPPSLEDYIHEEISKLFYNL